MERDKPFKWTACSENQQELERVRIFAVRGTLWTGATKLRKETL